MTIHPRVGIEKFIGYLGIVFFSFGVIIGFVWMILGIMRKPLARIYDNRLEYLIPAKMKYEIIPFLYVEMFVTVKVGAKLIRADYLTGGSKNTGIMNILVPVEKTCGILNDRLGAFWAQPMLSQPLNRTSVTKSLLTMGIESWRFDFDTTSKPNCIVVMRDGNHYKLVYVDDRGDCKTLSNHLTENDACRALLENFIEEDAFKSKHGIK
ncbi:MAG: hypothetical protein HDR93_06670 [Bacteroides sp.]|nr:hypothetical protein [Bacteroides sp.]